MADVGKIDASLTPKERHSDRRNSKIASILTSLVKFAVDSAVNDSRKGVIGLKKLYRIVQERFPVAYGRPEDCKLVMKKEEIQKESSELEQLNTTTAKCEGRTETQEKIINDGIGGSDFLSNDKRRIFIRSRL